VGEFATDEEVREAFNRWGMDDDAPVSEIKQV
jgi:hypothetical protein